MPLFSARPRAGNQETIGENLYYFRSLAEPANRRDCLVMAHGGWTEGGPTFTVPDGITVHFYVPHGATAANPSVQIHILERSNYADRNVYGPGSTCFNYNLGKVLGHGGDITGSDYYGMVEVFMDQAGAGVSRGGRNWAPNIVSVRNRVFKGRFVNLESLIGQVKAAHSDITTFYVLACRAVFTRGTWYRRGRIKEHEQVRIHDHVMFT